MAYALQNPNLPRAHMQSSQTELQWQFRIGSMYVPIPTGPALVVGTILTVQSTRFPLIKHWGVVYWPDPSTRLPRMIHGMKNDGFRITFMPEFDNGQPSVIRWTPRDNQQQAAIIQRMETLIGKPWDLFSLNCEQGVMWALTDVPSSSQLGGALLAGLAIAGLVALSQAQ